MMRRSLIQTALVAAMVLVGFSPWGGSPALAQAAEPACEAPRVGCLAPDFTLQDLNGDEITLRNLQGRPALISFWFTGCPICQGELVNWQAFHDTYGDLVSVVGINVADDPQAAQAFIDRLGLSLPVALDTTGRTTLRYRVTQMPATFFLDAAGVIRQISKAGLTTDEIAQVFAQFAPEVFRSAEQ